MKKTRREILKALQNKEIKIVCTHLDSGYCAQVEVPFILNERQREHLIRMYNQNNKMFRLKDNNKFSCLYDDYIIEG